MKVKYTHAQSQGLWWAWPWNTRNLGLVSRAQWMHAFSSLSESSFNIDSFKSMFSDMDSSRKEGRQLQKFLPGDSSFGNEMSCFQRVYLSEQSTSSKRNQFSKLAQDVQVGTRKLLGLLEMSYFLIMVVVTWVFMCIHLSKHWTI